MAAIATSRDECDRHDSRMPSPKEGVFPSDTLTAHADESQEHTFDEQVKPTMNGHSPAEKQSNGSTDKTQWQLDGHREAPKPVHRFPKKVKRKQKEETLLSTLCNFLVQHQIGISINLLLLLALTHLCFPRARRRTLKFFTLSYPDPSPPAHTPAYLLAQSSPSRPLYTQGWDDLYFVAFWIMVFTGLREAVMEYLLKPFARRGGVKTGKGLTRFAEQGWLFLYDGGFWTLGMYIMFQTPYWFNLPEMWTNFPTRHMTGLLKWYYLVQFAFWLQQIVVVNIEARRKDHWQMFSHHIITCALLSTSYAYYQTKVGNVILCCMDIVDIFLAVAKCLKYLGYSTLCDVAFGFFIITWFLTRHIFYNLISYSLYADVPSLMPYGCYSPLTGAKTSTNGGTDIMKNVFASYFQEQGAEVCFNAQIRWGFLGLLVALQIITLIWFGMIMRVAWKVLSGKGAEDSRSDDEDEEDVDEEEADDHPRMNGNSHAKGNGHAIAPATAPVNVLPLEEEVGVDALHFVRKTHQPRQFRKSTGGRSSGIHLPGHVSDRKELLGRIGCDKPT